MLPGVYPHKLAHISQELLRAIVWGLLTAAIPAFLSAQAAGSSALPPGQQAETLAESARPASMGGVNTGPPRPAQPDEQRQPITAGGLESAIGDP
jgi:hypothetical protein